MYQLPPACEITNNTGKVVLRCQGPGCDAKIFGMFMADKTVFSRREVLRRLLGMGSVGWRKWSNGEVFCPECMSQAGYDPHKGSYGLLFPLSSVPDEVCYLCGHPATEDHRDCRSYTEVESGVDGF